ncbi:hypothetical protein PIB30_049713 [Stylosanthes scabra]|uniref:Uncharacterized protein n=1 Tax=Stylosanthes scabra TaxID=79078 RepID=A0ABU6QH27_9FABA|nr:hypothetical protein [Stylosanthes scabra]
MGSGVIYYEYEKREKFEDYNMKAAKMSSPGRLSYPSPTDPELAPDNHRSYFPEDQSSGPDHKRSFTSSIS